MGRYSVEAGLDTTHTNDRPDQKLIEHRMRVLLSTIACEMFDVSTDADPDCGVTPQMRAARAWRDDMYRVLGLAIPKPERRPVPAAPAADPSSEPRVITTIRRTSAEDDWRGRGACRDRAGDTFFPVGTTGPALDEAEEAKAVCRRCPVRVECLSWAIDSGSDSGVWGGMTEGERRAEADRRRRMNAPA